MGIEGLRGTPTVNLPALHPFSVLTAVALWNQRLKETQSPTACVTL